MRRTNRITVITIAAALVILTSPFLSNVKAQQEEEFLSPTAALDYSRIGDIIQFVQDTPQLHKRNVPASSALLWIINGSSMEPALHENDTLVIDSNETFDTIELGDVVVFRGVDNLGPVFIAHRIFQQVDNTELGSENGWLAKGDSNDGANNGDMVLRENYVGTSNMYIPQNGTRMLPIPPAPSDAALSPTEETDAATEERTTTSSETSSSSGGSGSFLDDIIDDELPLVNDTDTNSTEEQEPPPPNIPGNISSGINSSVPLVSEFQGNITAGAGQQPENKTWRFKADDPNDLARQMQRVIFNDIRISDGNRYYIDRVIAQDIASKRNDMLLDRFQMGEQNKDCWFEMEMTVQYKPFDFDYDITMPCVDRPPREPLPVDNSTSTTISPPSIGIEEEEEQPAQEEEPPTQDEPDVPTTEEEEPPTDEEPTTDEEPAPTEEESQTQDQEPQQQQEDDQGGAA